VLAHALTTEGGAARAAVADLGWTWASGFAALSALLVRQRLSDSAERRGLGWMAAGCAVWCAGQLTWDLGDLVFGDVTRARVFADVGYVAIYPCLIVAAVALIRTQPRRDVGVEGTLDALIVTFTSVAVAYELLVRDALDRLNRASAVDMSILCGLGAIALLWTIVFGALYRTRLPRAAGTLALGGLLVFAASNVAYAGIVLSGRVIPGQVIDLGWNAAFLTIAAATGLTPRHPGAVLPGAGNSTLAPRLLALAVGVGGLLWLAVSAILTPQPELRVAIIVTVGGLLLAVRLAYALFADQRYATLLEREVERQTRSLIDSLDATAAAERSLRLVMDAVPDSIITLDRDGRPLDLNPAAWQLAAVAAGPRPGQSIFDGLEGDAARITRENLDAAFRGEVRRFEAPFRRSDGVPGVSAVLYAPVREGGEIRRVIALARDISEQRRTELQLQQSERLAAMGQLVGGVAHEINNPAAIISGFAQTLLRETLPDAQREMIEMIRDEATRIGRITSNLLAFARAGGKERTLVDLNEIVRRTHALRSYHLSTLNVAVALELDATDPLVWANGPELQQMLLNLLINAEQAVADRAEGRAIVLRTATAEHDVRIDVQDTGPGVPRENQKKIFDPFFTTKSEGAGTGLGLSICYGIVKEHGGRIWVDSDPGHGATFSVSLPRDPRTVRAPAASPAAPPTPPPTALRVLLVDDEAGLRNAATRYLEQVGITVDPAGDGSAGLELVARSRYDVIVCDVRMPGMDGGEFIAHLRRDHPELLGRLILSTGDTFDPDTAALLRDAAVPTLVKPFDFESLERLIRETAAGAAPRTHTGL